MLGRIVVLLVYKTTPAVIAVLHLVLIQININLRVAQRSATARANNALIGHHNRVFFYQISGDVLVDIFACYVVESSLAVVGQSECLACVSDGLVVGYFGRAVFGYGLLFFLSCVFFRLYQLVNVSFDQWPQVVRCIAGECS